MDLPVTIDTGDAADGSAMLPRIAQRRGWCHWSPFYFPAATQARVTAWIEVAGRHADAGGPLAWLRFEKLPDDTRPSLRLRTWPGGDELLAWVQPHGAKLRWLRDR